MNAFAYRDGVLHAESVPLADVAAQVGTPCYVYSRAALEDAYRAFEAALGGREHLVCYAMKANSNLAVLDLFARLGAGFDIVSAGELARALAAGGRPERIVFSGVGKTEAEIGTALASGILCFNVESAAELARIARIAAATGRRAPVSLRVNPDVDPRTHPYISTGLKENKFGVAYGDALALYRQAAAAPSLEVIGLGFHIGSQLAEVAPFVDALDRLLALADALEREGIRLRHVDIGGGLGIRYRDEHPPAVADYLGAMLARLAGRPYRLLLEPGRALVGNAGLLLTRVEYLKPGAPRSFAIVDAAMNDLMRPSLYDAWHDILPVVRRAAPAGRYEVVGPVCETGDFLGRDRDLAIAEGDLLAVMSAGAYGMSMSSNYNSRPRAAEVVVDGAVVHVVRTRESVESLFALERRLPGA
ncbi:MAG: diaminopimelate decarboxylase [Burkholderiales bacterium]|nr:diaminopimelate decarboxylase [Burkholderiales bacterium]